MDIEKQIKNFLLVAKSQIEAIDAIKSFQYEEHYKRILYFSQMEMLSKAVYGNKFNRDHRNKIINFINDFTSWEHAKHISLPQLNLALSKECPSELIELKNYTVRSLSNWSKSGPICISTDPHIDEIKELWPDKIKIGNKITLRYFRHDHLLYNLRNSYVHENRSPGYSFNLFSNEQPHYISVMKEPKDEHKSFELYHPVIFFKNLLLNALPQMQESLIKEAINPYDNFALNSQWVL